MWYSNAGIHTIKHKSKADVEPSKSIAAEYLVLGGFSNATKCTNTTSKKAESTAHEQKSGS